MATHLLIDGYNIIKRNAFDTADIEGARRRLIDELSRYGRERQIRITVVFDAAGGSSTSRQREGHRGVEVVYTRRGETADDVIVEAIRARRAGLVVATSDRAIIDEAKGHGVPFITPDRLAAALAGSGPDDEPDAGPGKKGNPRKAPKALRVARRAIRKI